MSHAKLCLHSNADRRADLCQRKRGGSKCPLHAPGGVLPVDLGDGAGEHDVQGSCPFAGNAVISFHIGEAG